jgi:DNA (cytosine-5)-methyltransferase 1
METNILKMTHGSLFSGIGGFDLAAEWMGWDNIFHCEWNPFGQKVLKHHFPNSISYNDITKTDFSIHRGKIDILTGGFPCQPYSTAGLRKGKEDERHLFPEMLRCIKEVKPRWIIGENVRGLVNWNGGMVFNEVCDDLEREGYEVQPFLIPAAGVNAPHQRYRIWFVAYSNNNGTHSRFREVQNENGKVSEWNNNAKFSDSNTSNDVTNSISIGRNQNDRFTNRESNVINQIGETGIITNSDNKKRLWEINNDREWESKEQESYNRNQLWNNIRSISESKNATDSEQFRLEHSEKRGNFTESEGKTQRERSSFADKFKANGWSRFPTKPPVCGGDDGLPRELDNITFPKWRQESIKAYGNAIVPQVAHQLFKAIQEFELMVNK